MKKTKFIAVIFALLLLVGLTGCGSKEGEVSYNNYTSIVLVSEATESQPASTYNGVISLLGGVPYITDNVSDAGDGYAEWNTEDAYVKVVFENSQAIEKEQTGLYKSAYTTPIGEKTGAWEWVITQLGIFTFHASNLFGLLGDTYLYWIGLLIMTLVIRTLGWPVYAKSNDMTLKMQMAQPELSKVQEKYRGKTDQASQQRMQMETMELYKKYKINVWGCLMPLLQMPIFIAMYQVVQRFPLTSTSVFGDASVVMNTNFLWTNLGNTEWLLNLPLAIVVAVTMFLSQWLIQKRTKANQKPNQYQDAKAQQSQKTMKYMMYFMVIMMAYISIGNAGIAFYWVIGNSYQLFQSYISHRKSGKRQEQLRKQF
ncbi:MAG: YidC/Oxa1 family membrane protein insertase [Firmicutes bacterium]|nr:YidC/Oxa1 family membrane protein insertase [Bacillota bacterium]